MTEQKAESGRLRLFPWAWNLILDVMDWRPGSPRTFGESRSLAAEARALGIGYARERVTPPGSSSDKEPSCG